MRDVLDDALEAWRGGETFGLATVVATWRSAPRQPGAAMIVRADGQVAGSVSGGCVEGAVYETALEVVASGEPALRRFGVSDDDAVAVGLSCGGTVDVFVERVDRASFPGFDLVGEAVAQGLPVAWCRVIEHPERGLVGRRLVLAPSGWSVTPGAAGAAGAAGGAVAGPLGSLGSLGSARIDDAVTADAAGLLAAGRSQALVYGPDGERLGTQLRVFVTCLAPRPRMVVFGAVDFAAAVARLGAFLGYRVSVCDARATFATPRRFPEAEDVVVEWPHRYLGAEAQAGRIDERTVLVVLTHDAKFDVPLLAAALRLPEVGYIGAMGSRRTHDERLRRLRDEGFSDEECARIHSPIGLDLGGRTPEETAVSIAAEIVSLRWGGDGRRLSEASGPIHHQPGRLE